LYVADAVNLLSQVGARTASFQLPPFGGDPCLPRNGEAPYSEVLVRPLYCRNHAQGEARI